MYAFRLASGAFGRIKGNSDLVYIGCTESAKGTLRKRLNNHIVDRPDKEDVGHRLHRVRRELGELELSWKTFTTSSEATWHEQELRSKYAEEHIEFPPLNRKESGKRVRKAQESVQQLQPDELAEVLEKLQTKGQK